MEENICPHCGKILATDPLDPVLLCGLHRGSKLSEVSPLYLENLLKDDFLWGEYPELAQSIRAHLASPPIQEELQKEKLQYVVRH